MPFHLTALILFILNLNAYCQHPQIKAWNKNNPIKWSDFLGSVDPISPYDANTVSGDTVIYRWHNKDGQFKINFEVYSLINIDKSWVRSDKKTQELLRHEQVHFDISEFFARQLLTALNRYRFTLNFKYEIFIIQKEEIRERTAMQSLYDEQTRHSRNIAFQKRWEEYLKDLLDNNYELEEAIQKEPW